MKLFRTFAFAVMVFMTITAKGQCKFCRSYEDFINDKWEKIDTIFCKKRSKNLQLWWGGNDFTLTTGNKDLDKTLKNEAFIVMQSDTAYLNCLNVRHDAVLFGKLTTIIPYLIFYVGFFLYITYEYDKHKDIPHSHLLLDDFIVYAKKIEIEEMLGKEGVKSDQDNINRIY